MPLTPQPARLTGGAPTLSAPAQGDASGTGGIGRARQLGLDASDDEKQRETAKAIKGDAVDPLDPMTRTLFAPGLRPSAVAAAPPAAPDDGVSRSSRVSMEHVLNRLVRRIAWAGDGTTGSARLELGAGALEGATLTIHSDDGKVRVSLELPPGADQAHWKERIARRLGAQGLQVTALEVE